MSKNWILENNFKIKKFVTDGIPEGYFNPTAYVFTDIENNNKTVEPLKNLQDLGLENTRRRHLKYKKIEGSEPNILYYDEMLSNSMDKLLYSNYDSIYNNYDSYTKYYENNEYLLKFELDEPNEYWVPRKYPRQRWKWFRQWGYDSPFQEYHQEDPLISYEDGFLNIAIDKLPNGSLASNRKEMFNFFTGGMTHVTKEVFKKKNTAK